jgi:hypothetical protein
MTSDRYEELKKEFTLDMQEGITDVISGKIDEYVNSFLNRNDILSYLKTVGFKETNSDRNGWQEDYWYYLEYNNIKYVVAGSGFYGNLSFSKTEEE